ncbi:hypothetical protein CH375_10035 [Leptospira ellisii]|nr:hypothetical protein CH375_10035 [Leptospira ellisii]
MTDRVLCEVTAHERKTEVYTRKPKENDRIFFITAKCGKDRIQQGHFRIGSEKLSYKIKIVPVFWEPKLSTDVHHPFHVVKRNLQKDARIVPLRKPKKRFREGNVHCK